MDAKNINWKNIDWEAVNNFLTAEKEEIEKIVEEWKKNNQDWYILIESYIHGSISILMMKKATDKRRTWFFESGKAFYYLNDGEKILAATFVQEVATKCGLKARKDMRTSDDKTINYKISLCRSCYENFMIKKE